MFDIYRLCLAFKNFSDSIAVICSCDRLMMMIITTMMMTMNSNADYHLIKLLSCNKHLVFAHLQVALQVLNSPVTNQIVAVEIKSKC